MPEVPIVAGRQPIMVEVEPGQSYWWCACGRSKSQPFCDGSHQGTGLAPVEFKPEKPGATWFCACKQTGNRPLCDGSHKRA